MRERSKERVIYTPCNGLTKVSIMARERPKSGAIDFFQLYHMDAGSQIFGHHAHIPRCICRCYIGGRAGRAQTTSKWGPVTTGFNQTRVRLHATMSYNLGVCMSPGLKRPQETGQITDQDTLPEI